MVRFLTLLIIALFGCSPPSTSSINLAKNHPSIIGGEIVSWRDSLQYHLVMIVSESLRHEYVCTGIVVNNRTILTAAHCVKEVEREDLAVYLGRNLSLRPSSEFRFQVIDVEVHKDYDHQRALSNSDVALLRLDREMPSQYLAPLFATSMSSKIQQVILYGYGQSLDPLGVPDEDSSGRLRMVLGSIYRKDYSEGIFWLDQQSQKGICEGDSGGPAFAWMDGEFQVVGINSNVLPLEWVGKTQHEIEEKLVQNRDGSKNNSFCKSSSRLMMISEYLEWIERSNQLLEQREVDAQRPPIFTIGS